MACHPYAHMHYTNNAIQTPLCMSQSLRLPCQMFVSLPCQVPDIKVGALYHAPYTITTSTTLASPRATRTLLSFYQKRLTKYAPKRGTYIKYGRHISLCKEGFFKPPCASLRFTRTLLSLCQSILVKCPYRRSPYLWSGARRLPGGGKGFREDLAMCLVRLLLCHL